MASSYAIQSSSSYDGRTMTLYLSQSYDIGANKSTIYWNLHTEGGSGWYATGPTEVYIDGNQVYYADRQYGGFPSTAGDEYGSIDVYHNSDGTRAVGVSLSTAIYTRSVSTDSGTWVLDTIPRYSNIISAPDFSDEDNPTITFTNPSGGYFPLRAKMEAGGNSQLIIRDIPANSTSCTFSLSEEERNTLRNLCTNSKTLGVRFTICCMSGGTELSASYLDRTMTVVNAAPTFTYTLVDTNPDTVALTGDNTKFIKSYNTMHYTITGAAYKGASIAGYQIINGNIIRTTSSSAFFNTDNNNFSFKVTDSRGFTTEQTVTPTMIPYVELTVNLAASVNTNGRATLDIKGNYFNGNFGVESNTLTLQYRYKEKGAEAYSAWETTTATKSNNTYEAEPIIVGLDYHKIYIFQARALDKLQTKNSSEITARALPVFDWNHDNFNINGDFTINGKTFLDLVYPIGSIYMSTVDTNPGDIFGGTWEQIEDRFLLAAGNTYTAGTTGGEAEHTLSIDEMPAHNHLFPYYTSGNGGGANGLAYNITTGNYVGQDIAGMRGAGGGQAHNNMPPYLTVYVWKRVVSSTTITKTDVITTPSGMGYGFSLNSNDYYQSQNSSPTQYMSCSTCRIDIETEQPLKITVEYILDAGSNFDRIPQATFSLLNSEISSTPYSSSPYQERMVINQSNTVKEGTLEYNIPAGNNFFMVRYDYQPYKDLEISAGIISNVGKGLQFKIKSISLSD